MAALGWLAMTSRPVCAVRICSAACASRSMPVSALLRFGVEEQALRRRLQSPVAAVEQRESELLLETRDLCADGGLRDAHGRRGIGDGAMVDDSAKRLEETDIHQPIKSCYCV